MKLLITGGAGFIGSHLTDFYLSKGHYVTVIDNFCTGKKEFLTTAQRYSRFTLLKADLTDYKDILKKIPDNIHTVFHLAANSDVAKGMTDPDIDFHNSTLATFNLLKVMISKKIRRIFYTSGSGIYGDPGSKKVMETYGPLFPVSYYGATKLSAESLIYAFSYLHNLKSFILRPANIIGVRATHGVIFDFINQLRKNPQALRILGDGKQYKSYLYISDVIEAINCVWSKSKERINLFNLSSNSTITVNRIAEIVIEEMGLTNVDIIRTGGYGGWKGDVPIIKLDNKKIKKLGWNERYNCEEAVRKTVRELIS